MRPKTIAVVTLALLVMLAPSAFAMGGGGRRGGGGAAVSGVASNGQASGTGEGGSSGGNFSSHSRVSASEPLAALAVGLGLLGVSFIRRRK